jgi:PAS domain S-box-containing protein
MSENAGRAGSPIDFLAGGGECGELLRQRDWSQTPLGPPEQWPRSLRTCLRIILTSRQPMFVWWGDALINLYNDAYKSIVGGKHPWALGAPAADVWREIWDAIRPRVQSAMLSNEGTYDEALLLIMERNGYAEETYYTFSYSPVPNDEGGTGGIICANTDDTLRIVGERQLALLRAVAAQTTDARTISDACRAAAKSLATDPHDLPFALLYLVDAERSSAVLAGSAGFDGSHPALVQRVAFDDASVWPLGEVVEKHGEVLIADLSHLEKLPQGAWERPPHQAVALPIAPSGGAGKAGVLVVGLNPYRLYDENYRRFLELLASQISASVANAQASEDERERAEALAELDRAKTAFFSNVSHEFRTPLTLMLAPMEELLSKAESGALAEEHEQLAVMYRNGRRLLRLVNTLLDFSRIEAGRVQASYEPLDLSAYTTDLASVFRSAVEKAGLRLIIDAPPLPEPVYADREMWEKIVLNLVSNAFKYTLDGEIEVSLRGEDGRALLRVRDTGIGIPSAELPRLFDRFHRVQGAQGRTHEGTGIGLALVQELAKLHGGSVEVESREGFGTTFTVAIPFGREHLPADRIQAPRTMVSTSSGAQSYVDEALRWLPGGNTPGDAETEAGDSSEDRECILLADDNADMRGYVERLLENDYQVMTAADGLQALLLAREHHPDLILTDVMMPNLDGFGLLEALRDDHRTASIPVIMLSARAGEEARVEGLSAGADDYLVKPFSARELFARVSGLLSLTRARREAAETLREIFERAPTIFAVLRGPQHIFEVVNPKYAELIGANRDVIGKPIREALPEIVSQGWIEVLDHVYETGEPFVGTEARVQLQRGGALEDAYVDFVYEPLRARNGAINGIFVHGVEVSAKVLARVDLEHANAALRDQAQLTRAITDNVTSALLMLDEQGHPTFVNPAFEAMTGFTLEEIAARPIHETLHHHHPDGRPLPIAECPITAAATRMFALKDHRDHFFRKDGSMFPVACSLIPIGTKLRGYEVARLTLATSQPRNFA